MLTGVTQADQASLQGDAGRPRRLDPQSSWRLEPSFVLAGAFTVLLGCTAELTALRSATTSTGDALVLAAVAATFACLTPLRASVPLAVMTWLFLNGFLENQGGDLRWHAGVDPSRIGSLLAVTLLAGSLGACSRRAHRRRRPDRHDLVAWPDEQAGG